jgi:hypothetical protein
MAVKVKKETCDWRGQLDAVVAVTVGAPEDVIFVPVTEATVSAYVDVTILPRTSIILNTVEVTVPEYAVAVEVKKVVVEVPVAI